MLLLAQSKLRPLWSWPARAGPPAPLPGMWGSGMHRRLRLLLGVGAAETRIPPAERCGTRGQVVLPYLDAL